jgi:hypothetical protein
MRDHFDCTPQQYHAGLDILWRAIEGHDLEGETAYHKCAARIAGLEAEVERLREQLQRQAAAADRAAVAAAVAAADAAAAEARDADESEEVK